MFEKKYEIKDNNVYRYSILFTKADEFLKY